MNSLMSRLSIQAKLRMLILAAIALSLTVAIGAVVAYDTMTSRARLHDRAAAMAGYLADQSPAVIELFGPEEAQRLLDATLGSQREVQVAVLYDVRGEIVARFLRDGVSQPVPAIPGGQGDRVEENLMVSVRPIISGDERVGMVWVGFSTQGLRDRLNLTLAVSGAILLVTLGLAFLVVDRLQRLITGPVLELAGAVRKVAADKDYTVRVEPRTSDEVGQLIDGFNGMIAAIQARDLALREANEGLEQRVQERTVDLTREVAERKQAEAALRTSEERLRRLLESANVVPWEADATTWRYTYVGPQAERLLGHPTSAWLAPGFWESCLDREGREDTVSRYRAMAFQHRDFEMEYRLRAVDGHEVWVRDIVSVVPSEDGAPKTLRGFLIDLTATRKLEEQLRQAQKMEAVGRLAGGIAHDFNNLLSAILGFGELASMELPPDHPVRPYVDEVRKASERAASLTRQLLAFSRRQVLQPKIVDVNSIVRDTEKMLMRLIGEDIRLETQLAPELGRVRADPGQIEQVLLNLVVNARDAMPKGGTITVETENRLQSAPIAWRDEVIAAGSYVRLTIRDIGTGMTPEVQAHLFEPFFTTKEQGRGTGLGLSTVYGIVKQSGGAVTVESEPGKGTTFRIWLPRIVERSREQETTKATTARRPGVETVLVVEDEERLRLLVRHVLQMNGYTVIEATNGRQGLALCETHSGPIDLLLTDVVMPEMGGRELAELAVPLRRDMRVLYMSGYTDDQILRHGVSEEKVPFLQKPFSPAALAEKVREVLDRRAG